MNQKIELTIFVIIFIQLTPAQASAGESGESSNESQCSEYSRKIVEGISELQDEQCDVTFIVGDKRFRVHKIVMSAGSPYFEAMFRHEMRESVSTEPIPLHDLDAETFEMIRSYIYTGRITICNSNAAALLEAASYLQMTDIKDDCCDHMKKEVTAMNCLRIRNIADKYSCSKLLNHSTGFALGAFEEVVQSESFLGLTKEHLVEIISDDRLNAPEDRIYEAVMDWIIYQDSLDGDRTVHLPDILQCVRFPQMNLDYLGRVSNDPLIKACKQGSEYLEEAKSYLSSHYLRGESDDDESLEARFKPRKTNYLFAVGGSMNGRPTPTVERYDPRTNKWTKVASMNTPRSSVYVIALNDGLYAIGSDGVLSSTECYNPHTDQWTDGMKLQLDQYTYIRIMTLKGFLYVIDSYHDVLKYDPNTNDWIQCTLLRKRRDGYAVAVLDDYIYILGGEENGQISNTVEAYDPTHNEWHNLTPMITKRHEFETVACDGYLYSVGGIEESGEILNSAERYDSRKDCWDLIPPMNQHRWGHGLTVANGLVYAAGGIGSKYEDLDTVEVYDPKTEEWSERASMLERRSYFGLAAVNSKSPPSRKMN